MTVIVCPNEGEMSDCKKKPKCKWGECEGQALPSDPEDYCNFGYNFREEYCDCEPIVAQDFITNWRYADILFANCGSGGINGCTPNGNIYFQTVIMRLPYSQEYWIPSGVVHIQSISQFCPNGPVNCGRTPASYGMNFGVFFASNGQPYTLDYTYPGSVGTGVFNCGNHDDTAILFKMQSDPTKVIGVMGPGGWGGAVGCTYNSYSLQSIEPYTGT